MTEKAATPHKKVVFITGRLAEPALRRVLGNNELPFASEVVVLRITVAALMTTEWIGKQLPSVPADADLVLLPGLCEGDSAILAAKYGVKVEKGPKDLRDIPQHFGRQAKAAAYGKYRIEILAEINNAPKLEAAAVHEMAAYFRASGADLIDLGCTPGRPFPELSALVRDLKADGFRVSIDSFDPTEIISGLDAGAEMVLSLNASNLAVAERYAGSSKRFVVIPDLGRGLDTLEPSLEALDRWKVPYLIDPVIEPIGFGFMASLERYAETRRRWPEAPQLMGVGNITELTAADSTGVNALLIAICEELGIEAVLTTEVINWARGSVREIDVARRLMHYAITERQVPKGVDDRLVTLKDTRLLAYSEAELRELQAAVTDPNFRIFADRDTITVFNHELFIRGTDPNEIFRQLGVDEATHAFYLGRELMKAKLAIQLGKTYRQEGALDWGYLTGDDDVKSEHVKLTQRSRRSRAKRTES